MTERDLVSIVTVNYNGLAWLEACVASVLRAEDVPIELVVVDNASADGSRAWLEARARREPRLRPIFSDTNRGWAGGLNLGIREARGRVLLLLNNDTEIHPACPRRVRDFFEQHPDAGACQPKLVQARAPERLDCVGALLNPLGYHAELGRDEPDTGQYDRTEEVFAPKSAAMGITRAALAHVGLFDERMFAYYEDVDLSWRLRLAGYRILRCPEAVVSHRGSATVDGAAGPTLRRALVRLTTRNQIRTLLKNYAPGSLARFLPLLLLLKLARAAAYGIELRVGDAFRILGGLAWNVAMLPDTWRARRAVQRLRRVGDRAILDAMYWGFHPQMLNLPEGHALSRLLTGLVRWLRPA